MQEADVPFRYLFNPGLPHAYAYQASAETSRLVNALVPFIDEHR